MMTNGVAEDGSSHMCPSVMIGHNEYSSLWTIFPAWLARHKGHGRIPKVNGEITLRATPEPSVAPWYQGRRRGRQCPRRGSGPVVVVGVTSHQGVRESRAQGKGG